MKAVLIIATSSRNVDIAFCGISLHVLIRGNTLLNHSYYSTDGIHDVYFAEGNANIATIILLYQTLGLAKNTFCWV